MNQPETRGRRALVRGSAFLFAGAGLATFAGFFGAFFWVLDLFAHFRVHYAWILFLSALGFAIGRRRLWTVAVTLILLVNLLFVVPLYCNARSPDGAARLKLVSFNLNTQNDDLPAALEFLSSQAADVIVLQEVTPEIAARVAKQVTGYQTIASPRSDLFGIVVLSKLPVKKHDILRLAGNDTPAIEVELEFAGARLSLLAIHAWPPFNGTYTRRRDQELRAAASWARQRNGRAIVTGDFNATPWSSAYRALIHEGGLENSQRGFGIQASWPVWLGSLGIPIDHCLHSRDLTTVDRVVGPALGSDHRPITVTLAAAAK